MVLRMHHAIKHEREFSCIIASHMRTSHGITKTYMWYHAIKHERERLCVVASRMRASRGITKTYMGIECA